MTRKSSNPSPLLEVTKPSTKIFDLNFSETELSRQEKQTKVVLDTNIYISAIMFGGNPKKILKLAMLKKIKVFISTLILLEISGKLHKKFKLSEEDVTKILKGISKITEVIQSKIKLDVVKEDPSDNKVLECAVASNTDYIVTGDKHLLELKRFEEINKFVSREIKIVTPADLLKIIKV